MVREWSERPFLLKVHILLFGYFGQLDKFDQNRALLDLYIPEYEFVPARYNSTRSNFPNLLKKYNLTNKIPFHSNFIRKCYPRKNP